MPTIKLDAEWTRLLDSYKADHQHPVNQRCHKIGIPMIASSFPIGATLVGLPLATTLFSVGWGFQFVGHAFEGKKPSFVEDKRALLVGLLWWAQKSGFAEIHETRFDAPPAHVVAEAPLESVIAA